MNVFFDTNVVLDAMLDRVESGSLIGLLGATTFTTVHYIARRSVGTSQAHGLIGDLLQIFEVASVNRAVLDGALALGFADFEDAVLHEAGRLAGAHAVVTRDPSGFSDAALRVYEPNVLVAALDTAEGF